MEYRERGSLLRAARSPSHSLTPLFCTTAFGALAVGWECHDRLRVGTPLCPTSRPGGFTSQAYRPQIVGREYSMTELASAHRKPPGQIPATRARISFVSFHFEYFAEQTPFSSLPFRAGREISCATFTVTTPQRVHRLTCFQKTQHQKCSAKNCSASLRYVFCIRM